MIDIATGEVEDREPERCYLSLKQPQMPWSHLNDPKRWRERAEEARTVAEYLTDPEAKRMMPWSSTIAND